MTQIQHITGQAIPLVGADIDTDRIIPARFLRCVTFEGLGEQAFKDDRIEAKGNHPFDLPQYQGAEILVVNANFGCGSSREHAPQSLAKWGIKALIGESFAEIFFGNCTAIGVVCVTANANIVSQIQAGLKENPKQKVSIDLEALTVKWAEETAPIFINEGSRQMLVKGTWDTCGQLLKNQTAIENTAKKIPYLVWS